MRAYEAYQRKEDDLERHTYLRALQDTTEVLFYRLLLGHIKEMTPIVYTPTIASACEQFSQTSIAAPENILFAIGAVRSPNSCGAARVPRSMSSS